MLGRDPNASHIGRIAARWLGETADTFKIFSPLGPYLPDFLHPFGFILLTLAPFPNAGPVMQRMVCLGWFAFNAVFEVGQLYDHAFAQWISKTLPQGDFSAALADYFIHGTFDGLDLIAILLGSSAAYLFITKIKPIRQPKKRQ